MSMASQLERISGAASALLGHARYHPEHFRLSPALAAELEALRDTADAGLAALHVEATGTASLPPARAFTEES